MNKINPLDNPICLRLPLRKLPSSWIEHTPFALYLMDIIRPRLFVELGTFYGVSYCAFCQAVDELGLNTQCYAVDTWSGDAHTGPYGSDVLENLEKYHNPLYGKFSRLLRMTFDQALNQFQSNSIDLLHIDGYHTYESVKHDFQNWLPKLSHQGIVIFHDTNERDKDFGVWKLFEELKTQYPYFEFFHGHGLGMIFAGQDIPLLLRPLLNLSETEVTVFREFFYELGKRASFYALLVEKEKTENDLRSDIYIKNRELEKIKKSLIFKFLIRYPEIFMLVIRDKKYREKLFLLIKEKFQFLKLKYLKPVLKIIDNIFNFCRNNSFRQVIKKFKYKIKKKILLALTRKAVIDKGESFNLINNFKYKPLISIVLPTYNTPVRYLKMAIDSVMSQIYPYWELCICDDGSTDTVILNFLQSLEDGNKKIKVSFLQENKGISITTNQAIKHSSGEYVAFLDHDDELTPDALFEVVKLLNEQPDLDVIYSDQDKITQTGRLKEPFFKPSWSPEYFRAVMYIGHLLIVRREIIIQIGGLDSYFDGIQDYELMLRISEKTSKISHISKILYHWRMLPGSIALGLEEKGKKIDYLQVEAVNRHLIRRGINAEAFPHPKYRHRVVIQPKPRKQSPKISIIILTKDSPVYITRCLSSIFEKTTYPNYEIIVVNNGTTDPLTFSFSKANRIKIIDFRQPFNYSRANNLGVSVAEGEIIVLLNNDTEIISADWLEQMLFYLDDPTISIVGPMLIYPNKRVQHAGIVLGLRGTADHIMRGFPSDSDGYAGSLSSPRTVSAVTGACLMMRKNDYINAGGLIEYYGTHYQDVDLCLRFLSANLRIVYTPYAVLIHYEGATRGKKYDHLDRALLLDTWGDEITKGDQYYNSNFLRDFPDYFAG